MAFYRMRVGEPHKRGEHCSHEPFTGPDAESSLYFSGVTYATIGYGGLVLPKEWRLFGPVEGLTGILMCGLSTAFLFATLSRMYWARTHQN